MLHEKNSWLKFSLQHWLSWWALVNSYTYATDKGSNILVLKPNQEYISNSVTFFLELNHEKLTIWYQIVQCHFVHTAQSLVPYLIYRFSQG